MYESSEEELNEKMIKLKTKLNQLVCRTKQLNEEINNYNHVIMLMNEMKVKEDTFEVEQNELKTEIQCLKKKNAIMEKHIENLNSKVCAIIVCHYAFQDPELFCRRIALIFSYYFSQDK